MAGSMRACKPPLRRLMCFHASRVCMGDLYAANRMPKPFNFPPGVAVALYDFDVIDYESTCGVAGASPPVLENRNATDLPTIIG